MSLARTGPPSFAATQPGASIDPTIESAQQIAHPSFPDRRPVVNRLRLSGARLPEICLIAMLAAASSAQIRDDAPVTLEMWPPRGFSATEALIDMRSCASCLSRLWPHAHRLSSSRRPRRWQDRRAYPLL